MPSSLPQTYLIILSSLLFILAIVVGRQVLKVRSNEVNLVTLEKNININSSNVEELYKLASAQLNKRLYPQATNTLAKALKKVQDEPNDAKAIIENAMGFALAAQEKFKDAIKHYENAIKAKSNYPVAINNLAFAKQKVSKDEDAYKLYQEVLKLDPNNKTASKQMKKMNIIRNNDSENIIYKKGF